MPNTTSPHARARLAVFVFVLVVVFGLVFGPEPAEAAPPVEESHVGIPPDREAAARELLAPLLEERSDDLSLQGPSIERDRIKWWLMRGDEARAVLVLLPRSAGQPEDPRSKSFAMQVAWAPEVEPEPVEQALLAAAVEAVQARDEGGFYVMLVDTLLEREDPLQAQPHARAIADDPERVRRWWALKVAAVALLAGLAAATSLRPRRTLEGV
ncbi:MAG: hypothetical protein R6X02_15630 [Enhygromyxa sp.]